MAPSPDYSASSARAVQSSRFPADGGALDLADKAATRLISRLRLPMAVECVLSCPGCFFGMPAFLVAGPQLVSALVAKGAAPPWRAGCTTAALVATWLAGVHPAVENKTALGFLYAPPVMVAAPVVGSLLSGDCGAARYATTLWLAAMVPVVAVKRAARRRRPVTFDFAAAEAKRLGRISRSLRASDPNASFPSGDVAGATAFACALSSTHPTLAVAVVALSAFGRMYYHAHHVTDCAVGCLLTLLAHAALAQAGVTATTVAWWAPLLAEVFALPLMKLFSTWKGEQLKQT